MTDLPRTLEYLPVEDLPPDPQNAKGHSADTIRRSISELGYIEPVVVDDRGRR